MSEARERHFGPIEKAPLVQGGESFIDIGALVRRLILFERVAIETSSYNAVPEMIRVFGLNGVRSLLDHNCFDFLFGSYVVAYVGQLDVWPATQQRGCPLPPGSHRLESGYSGGAHNIHNALDQMLGSLTMPDRPKRQLRTKVLNCTRNVSERLGVEAERAYNDQLLQAPETLTTTLRNVVQHELRTAVGGALTVELEPLPIHSEYRISTNLTTLLGITEERSHDLVAKALGGTIKLNLRLGLMADIDSVTGFRADEAAFIESRIQHLTSMVDPATIEDQFDRVLRIGGLPGLQGRLADSSISVDALLALRDEPDCVDLRSWLRGLGATVDQDISTQFATVSERLTKVTGAAASQEFQLVVANTSGLVSPSDIPASLGSGDTFLLGSLLSAPGPIALLSRSYASIFST